MLCHSPNDDAFNNSLVDASVYGDPVHTTDIVSQTLQKAISFSPSTRGTLCVCSSIANGKLRSGTLWFPNMTISKLMLLADVPLRAQPLLNQKM